jgi:multidrug transporter EmrE-like cation transporter
VRYSIPAILFLLLSTFTGVGGQLFLKKATLNSSFSFDYEHPIKSVVAIATNPYALGWLILAALSAFLWVRVVQIFDLSVAFPIMLSLTIVFILIFSYFLFGEQISTLRWIGIAMIIIGIFFTSN